MGVYTIGEYGACRRKEREMRRSVLIAMVVGIAAGVFAGPLASGDLPANVKWVMHFDSAGFAKSKICETLLSTADKGVLENQQAVCKNLMGFDPLTDVKSVTLYGTDYANQDVVAVFRGNLDQDKIATLVGCMEGIVEGEHSGGKVISWPAGEGRNTGAVCFLNAETILLAKDDASVKQAADVIKGFAGIVSADMGNAIFMLEATALPAQAGSRGMLLQNADWVSIRVGEDGENVNLEVALGANNEEMAQSMEIMMRGIQAMTAMNQNVDDKGVEALKNAAISRVGKTVQLKISAAVQDIHDLIKQQVEMQKKMTGNRTKRHCPTE